MANLPDVSAPDLAALLASRLCHDIISPVGAIQSGLELLEEMPDDPDAMALVRSSTKSAVAKLQFARIAFGASGSPQASLDLGDARSVAEGFMGFEKPTLTWNGERAYVAKNLAKTLLNLIVVANSCLPRGGTIDVSVETPETDPRFTLVISGPRLRVPERFLIMLNGKGLEEPLDSYGIQPYYALLLAQETGLGIEVSVEGETARIVAAKKA
ncbi:histidine phosphotransferase ChpT [Consotaella salsifontis]|uniref:Histidine phosphotransferase ChpT n=1 Tax=Consotaella salsifontis TaxID=1365950 RepID=A0A1T4RDN8_9HYPH|nr:histidine phosphotransferase family protein [Consotaella salsifontis]SKA14142.1 histidine phosphotransferase ChpT [Consotaella salsifontis]